MYLRLTSHMYDSSDVNKLCVYQTVRTAMSWRMEIKLYIRSKESTAFESIIGLKMHYSINGYRYPVQ